MDVDVGNIRTVGVLRRSAYEAQWADSPLPEDIAEDQGHHGHSSDHQQSRNNDHSHGAGRFFIFNQFNTKEIQKLSTVKEILKYCIHDHSTHVFPQRKPQKEWNYPMHQSSIYR